MVQPSDLEGCNIFIPDGDAETQIFALGKKLYESLPIGENRQPTKRRCIMKAHGQFLTQEALDKK